MANIGETVALIPQTGSSYKPKHLQDGADGNGLPDFLSADVTRIWLASTVS